MSMIKILKYGKKKIVIIIFLSSSMTAFALKTLSLGCWHRFSSQVDMGWNIVKSIVLFYIILFIFSLNSLISKSIRVRLNEWYEIYFLLFEWDTQIHVTIRYILSYKSWNIFPFLVFFHSSYWEIQQDICKDRKYSIELEQI